MVTPSSAGHFNREVLVKYDVTNMNEVGNTYPWLLRPFDVGMAGSFGAIYDAPRLLISGKIILYY